MLLHGKMQLFLSGTSMIDDMHEFKRFTLCIKFLLEFKTCTSREFDEAIMDVYTILSILYKSRYIYYQTYISRTRENHKTIIHTKHNIEYSENTSNYAIPRTIY